MHRRICHALHDVHLAARMPRAFLNDFIVTSEEAGAEKPHYHFFDICVEKAGVRPEECAFIGDNVRKDIEGAWESGMKGIWYTQEKEPPEHRYFPTIRSFRGIDVDEFLK